MNNRKLVLVTLLASFIGGILSLFGYAYLIKEPRFESIERSQKAHFTNYLKDLKDTNIAVPQGLNFIYSADVVRPAVVHIRTYYQAKVSQNPSFQGSPFEDMLKDYFGDRFQAPEGGGVPHGGSPQQEASGSGVILSEDGYIVTNNHVIENSDKVEVVLNDKRSYIATVVGTDPTTDLSLIKIDAKDLPYVKYGNSESVKIGEWVLAVGNPFNLTSTVTAGIVSAKARNIHILRDKDNMAVESFIQTDAVVNPGNSGGALVNLKGELIGINTAIASPTGSYTGYSFAVPVTLVKKVMEDLLKHGNVQRALLGVSILDINAALAKEKEIKDINGVYIAAVNENSAAEKAGLKEGDIITQINGVKVNSASELQEAVAVHRPGDKVKVTYLRKDKISETEVTLKNKAGTTDIVKREESPKASMGAALKNLSKDEMKKLDLEGGAKVESLSGGKFRDAGIREGFIITFIDKIKVNSASEAQALLDKAKQSGRGLLIEGVYPNGQKAFYAIAE